MASKQTTVDYILEQLAGAHEVSAKKMFGEYGIYHNKIYVALVCDDQLFVKKTIAGQRFLGTFEELSPYPGAKPCFLISGEKWEDREWLTRLIALSAAELASSFPPTQKRSKPKK